MKLLSLQVGLPRNHGQPGTADLMDREWTSGFFKEPVAGPVRLWRTQLEGDGQADLDNHGGPDKAVNVYPAEHYPFWQAELSLAAMPFGGFGENFTVQGLLEADVCVGDIYEIGGAIVQISQPRQPCWKLGRRWRWKNLPARVEHTGRTGWYFRVLQEGFVEAGAPLRRLERPCPEWSIAAANEIMHHGKTDFPAALKLAACPLLSASWRTSLQRRAEKR